MIEKTVLMTKNGNVYVYFNKEGKLQIEISRHVEADIVHLDSGVPGVIGPDVVYDLQSLTEKTCQEQLELSRNTYNGMG